MGLVVLFPTQSYQESPPIKLLFEYMLCGLPVIASDFPVAGADRSPAPSSSTRKGGRRSPGR